MENEIKDTTTPTPETNSQESVSLSKEEVKSLKNYAAAQARIAAEKKIQDGYVTKDEYNKILAERDNLLFESNKAKFLDEYLKNGGKKDSFDTFCKYHKDIVIELDPAKRQLALIESSKVDSCFFTKQIATPNQIAQSAPQEVQQASQPQQAYYFDENGILRTRK